jgi:hypothetical protein
VDTGARFETGIVEDLRARASFHHFRTEDETETGERTLGSEVDVVLAWRAHAYVTLEALYGIFLPGSAMRDVQEARQPTVLLPGTLGPEHQVFVTLDARF